MLVEKSSISKIILSGEHAVVYGTPSIAIPVFNCKSYSKTNRNNLNDKKIIIKAPQLNKIYCIDKSNLKNRNDLEPLEITVYAFFEKYNLDLAQDLIIEIFSEIPIASGMGSGASISASIIKSLAEFFNIKITKDEIYQQVFEIEKIYHGNPSGIDPTVIVYEKPVYFIKGKNIEEIKIKEGFVFAIIDSKIKSSTIKVVNWVKEQRNKNILEYDNIFKEIGSITNQIKIELESGDKEKLGFLLNKNHNLLNKMGVSISELDDIVSLSKKFGAYGSKMSGAGWGGVVIALIDKKNKDSFTNNFTKLNLDVIIF